MSPTWSPAIYLCLEVSQAPQISQLITDNFSKLAPWLPFLSLFDQSPIPMYSPLKYFWNVAFLPWSSLSLPYHLLSAIKNPSMTPANLMTISPVLSA